MTPILDHRAVAAGALLSLVLALVACSGKRSLNGFYPVLVDFDRGEVFVCHEPGNEDSYPAPCMFDRGSPEYPKVHGALVSEVLENVPNPGHDLHVEMDVSLSPQNELLAYELRH